MKSFLSIIAILFVFNGYGQTSTETEILRLSDQIFKWEVENKIDSLEKIFDEKFIVVGSSGESQTKKQYITRLKSGNFLHNSIDVETNTVTVSNNTATVIGKGKFDVTVSGNKITLILSYLEVFSRSNTEDNWKILGMHASVLQH
ncbi:MAG: nuclear transport factor 2 family protein [Bacteroidota bacterium]|nr:nuclear transport factor 2 family protein [Bacteroidota bacterium]